MVSSILSLGFSLAVLFSLSTPAFAGISIGGATLAQNLFNNAYVPKFNQQGSGAATFAATSSEDGITGLAAGKYDVGVSGVPFSAAQEAGVSKITVPTAVATFSFFTGTGKSFKITGEQVASILTGVITTWDQIPESGLSGTITFVTRSDASGTTDIISQFLASNHPGWAFVGEGPFSYPNKNVVYVKGSSAVLAALKASKTTLAALQTGIATAAGFGELKVKNKVGNFVASTIGSGSFTQALPRVTPAPTASWHGVSLINQIGVETYPIVSFLYTFYKLKSSSPAQAVVIKAFARFVLSGPGQALNGGQSFYAVPAQYTRKSLKAVKKIT